MLPELVSFWRLFHLSCWGRIQLLPSPGSGRMSSYGWNLPGSPHWLGLRVHSTHASAYTHAPLICSHVIRTIASSQLCLPTHPRHTCSSGPPPHNIQCTDHIFSSPNLRTLSFILFPHRWWVLHARHCARYLGIIWPQKLTYACFPMHRCYMKVSAHPLYI